MENCVHAARLTFSLRLIRRARGENWFTTKPVGRAFPSNPASVVNNHVQLLLCWGFPFLWPSILFPSPPICLFASGKWLCRYSQVQFQKVRLMKANCELRFGQIQTFQISYEWLQEPWRHPQPAGSNAEAGMPSSIHTAKDFCLGQQQVTKQDRANATSLLQSLQFPYLYPHD